MLVLVVLVVLVVVVGCLWWHSSGRSGGDSLCKGGSFNSCKSASRSA